MKTNNMWLCGLDPFMGFLTIPLFLVVATSAGCGYRESDAKSLSHILGELGPDSSASERSNATVSLQNFGTNTVPLLIAEMNSFKWQTPEEKDEQVISRTQRLRVAFEVLGTNLAPFRQEFADDLETNRNFMSALDGLAAMGRAGAESLVEAITNREPPVRFNAVLNIIQVATNTEVAKLAVPNMLLLLNDQSPMIRATVCEALGICFDDRVAVVPFLLKVAGDDPDLVVRSQSVKALGRIQKRFGVLDSKTRSTLEKISRQDNSQIVRSSAVRILAGKEE